MSDAQRRHHEIRIGMNVYWAQTWPEKDGFGWTAHNGKLGGYTEGTRHDALTEIRNGLLAREQLRRAAGLDLLPVTQVPAPSESEGPK
jgi:hypothetical protein